MSHLWLSFLLQELHDWLIRLYLKLNVYISFKKMTSSNWGHRHLPNIEDYVKQFSFCRSHDSDSSSTRMPTSSYISKTIKKIEVTNRHANSPFGPVRLTPYSACLASFFSRNSVFLSQQFSRNSVFSQFQPRHHSLQEEV